jgi:hypothetical protein
MPQEVRALAASAADIRHDRQQRTNAPVPGGSGTAQLASPLAPAAPVQQETGSGDSSVVVPAAANPAEARRLPIYEAVESSWFSAAHRTPGPARTAVKTTGGQWSSPADEGWRAAQTVESPTVGSSTKAGLPRRTPNANLIPGAIPGSQPAEVPSRSAADVRDRLAGFQRGVTEGRAAASEAAKPAGDDGS